MPKKRKAKPKLKNYKAEFRVSLNLEILDIEAPNIRKAEKLAKELCRDWANHGCGSAKQFINSTGIELEVENLELDE
jgi:hypothetical protein